MRKPVTLFTALSFCFISFQVDAQFLVERGLTFGKVVKHEQAQRGVKKGDVKQGPLLKPNKPGLPEIEVYKRALVFQRIMDADTISIVYFAESNGKIDDASKVLNGEFVWRPSNKQRLISIRDSLLSSLDGKPRTFTVTKKKLKKKAVVYTYVWSDPTSFPKVTIDYQEKARVPRSLQMRIDYNELR